MSHRPAPFRRRQAVLLLVVIAALAGCGRGDAADEAGAAPAQVAAVTVVVTAQPFSETVGAIGTVEPRAGHVAALSAPAPGRVARVLVAAGQHVAAGQPLVELDQAPFRAAAQSAESALGAAQQAYDRAQRLANEGIVPRKDAEQAAADLARARADAAGARREAALATLRAPIAGVVTRMSATLGASVEPSQPLVEVADPAALDVLFGLTPGDAARVRPGAKVALTAGERATGESLGVGEVVDVAGIVDTTSRRVGVRVRAPTTQRPLRIDETVYGQITVATTADAIVVPTEALVPEGDGFKVFVVDASGIAHERPVKVGGRTAALAHVTAGLAAGERVVSYGAYGVEDSARVVPVRAPGAAGGAGSPPAP